MVSTIDKVEEQVTEWLKCKGDFEYFATHYIVLELPGRDELYKPYKKQLEYVELLQKDHYVITLKSRQLGLSLTTSAYLVWCFVFNRNVTVGIISKDGGEATRFSRRVASLIDKLPAWLRPKFLKRNEQTFELDNGGICTSAAVNLANPTNVLRGTSNAILVIDECAFVPCMDEAWISLVPSTSVAQKQAKDQGIPYGTFMISTPNGLYGRGQFFANRWAKALEGNDIFVPFQCHWKEVEEISSDPNWYKQQCSLFDDPKKIQQELEMQFLGAEGSFLPESTIAQLQEQTKDKEPIEKYKMFNGEIWVFEHPIPGKVYLMGVDTAPENGEDRSAAVIIDFETGEQVWEFVCKCQITDYIKVIKGAVVQYNCLVITESNSYGNQVIEDLNNSEFCTMLYKEKRGEQLVPGLSTNIKTRPLMIESIYNWVTMAPEIIKSKRLAFELIGLEYKKNTSGSNVRVEAGKGGHDDIAMALSFCLYVRQHDPPLLLTKTSEQFENLMEIMDMNNTYMKEQTNTGLRKQVINELDKGNKDGFIDIFTVMNG